MAKTIVETAPVVADRIPGETNDCTVVATATVLGISYREAHALLRRDWKRPDKRGVYYFHTVKGSLNNRIGKDGPEVEFLKREWLLDKESRNWDNPRMTLAKFCRVYSKGTYLVTTRGHIQVVKDGRVIDNGHTTESAVGKTRARVVEAARVPDNVEYKPEQKSILAQYMELAGVSREEMAEKLNVSVRTLYRYEKELPKPFDAIIEWLLDQERRRR